MPVNTMFAFGTRVMFDELPVSTRSVTALSTSLTVTVNGARAVSSFVDLLGLPEIETVGGSFTGVTVIVNVWAALVSTPPLVVPPLSCICTVTVAEPFALAAGV